MKKSTKTQSDLDRATRALLGMGAVEHRRPRFTKPDLLRMPVPDTGKPTIQSIIHQNVRPGSTFCADEARRCGGIANRRRTVNHSAKEYVNGMVHTNGIEGVWAALKREFNGICHHWSKKHCRNYVNEFAFRLDGGNCERDTQDRLDDLFRGMVGKTVTYGELVQGEPFNTR